MQRINLTIEFKNNEEPALNDAVLNRIVDAINEIDDKVCRIIPSDDYIALADETKAAAQSAKDSADRAEVIVGIGIATNERPGIVKPNGTSIHVSEDGTLSTPEIDEQIDTINEEYEMLHQSVVLNTYNIGGVRLGSDDGVNPGFYENGNFYPFSKAECIYVTGGNALNKTAFGIPSSESANHYFNPDRCEHTGTAQITMKKGGTVKVVYSASGYSTTGSTAYGAYSEILKNGSVVGASTGNQTRIGISTATFEVNEGDVLQVYTRGSTTQSGGYTATFFFISSDES